MMMLLLCCSSPLVVVDAAFAAASIRPRRLAWRAGGQRIRHVRGFVVVSSSMLVGSITIRRGASPSDADVDALAATKSIGRRSSLRPKLTPRILLPLCDVATTAAAVAQVHLEGAHGAGGVIVIVIVILAITRIGKQPGPRVPEDHLLHRGRYFDRDAPSLLCRCGGGGDGPAGVGVAAVELRQRLGGVRRVVGPKVGAPARAAAEAPAQRRGGARRQVVVVAIVIAFAVAGILGARGDGATVAGLLRGYDGGSGTGGGIGRLGPSPQRHRISCLRGERFHRARGVPIALLRRYYVALLCCSTGQRI